MGSELLISISPLPWEHTCILTAFTIFHEIQARLLYFLNINNKHDWTISIAHLSLKLASCYCNTTTPLLQDGHLEAVVFVLLYNMEV